MNDTDRVLGGRWRVQAKLAGDDGLETHRAFDVESGHEGTLRIVLVDGEARRDRSFREIKRAAQLDHPGLARALDVGLTEGGIFVVIEPIEGERLDQRIARTGPMSPRDVIAIAVPICRALAVAHDAGVVHRDLRPSNVVLVEPHEAATNGALGEDGRAEGVNVKITELGLAGLARASGPRLNEGAESPYVAPEQRRGEPVGRRADVYSVGAMLHTMSTGSPPTAGASFEGPLAAVVTRCLAEDPRERFMDTNELEAALLATIPPAQARRILSSQPPPPKEPSLPPPALPSSPPSAPPTVPLVTSSHASSVVLVVEPPSASSPPATLASSAPPPRPMSSSSPPAKPSSPPASSAEKKAAAPRPPAAPPERPLARPMTVRPAWEDTLLDVRDGPIPRVVLASVLAFAIARFFAHGFVPWLASFVAGTIVFIGLRARRAGR